MNQVKIYKIGFIILLVLNVLLILMPLLQRGVRGPHRSQDLKGVIIRELKFTANQEDQLDALAHDHHQQIRRIDDKMKNVMEQYFETLVSENDNLRKSLKMQISQLQIQKVEVTYTHFQDIKSLCSVDQLKNFPQLLNHAMRMISGGPKKNRRPPKRF